MGNTPSQKEESASPYLSFQKFLIGPPSIRSEFRRTRGLVFGGGPSLSEIASLVAQLLGRPSIACSAKDKAIDTVAVIAHRRDGSVHHFKRDVAD